jgi:hypothetical protein
MALRFISGPFLSVTKKKTFNLLVRRDQGDDAELHALLR